MQADASLAKGLEPRHDAAEPLPEVDEATARALLQAMATGAATVAKRHDTWLKSPKKSGVYARWKFGEGTDHVLGATRPVVQAETLATRVVHRAQGVVASGPARSRATQRYFKLDTNGLDAGLHEFIRSAAAHYHLARRAREAATSAEERLTSAAPAPADLAAVVKQHAKLLHHLTKSRRYLAGCMQLALYCYDGLGVLTPTVEGSPVDPPGQSLLGRLPGVLPEFHHALDIVAAVATGGAGVSASPIDLEPLRVPRVDVHQRSRLLGLQLQTRLDAVRVAGQDQTPTGSGRFDRALATALHDLQHPSVAKRVAHHYKRKTKEADRTEKVFKVADVTVGAAKHAVPPVALSFMVIGFAVRPVRYVLKPIPWAAKKAFRTIAPESWTGTADSTSLVIGTDEHVPEDQQVQVRSARWLAQHDLQALAAGVDGRIVAAARHLHDATTHLDGLESLTRMSPPSPLPPTARNRVRTQAELDAARILPAQQADRLYEVAHHLHKAMRYLDLAAALELSLDLGLTELEAAAGAATTRLRNLVGGL